jgi:hypothetical protein
MTTVTLLNAEDHSTTGPAFMYPYSAPINGPVTITVTGSPVSLIIETNDAVGWKQQSTGGNFTVANQYGIRARLVQFGTPVTVTASF